MVLSKKKKKATHCGDVWPFVIPIIIHLLCSAVASTVVAAVMDIAARQKKISVIVVGSAYPWMDLMIAPPDFL